MDRPERRLAAQHRGRSGALAQGDDLRRPRANSQRRGDRPGAAEHDRNQPGPRPAADRRPGDGHPAGQPDRQRARDGIRLLQLQRADAMNKNPPSTGRIAAMVLFTLSVFALLLFLWVSFGGVLPLKAQGYRFKADFPEAALLAKEADVRMAGVNVGKIRSTELGPGGRSTRAEIEIDDRFAPIKADTRAILRQKSLLGETYVELTPGQPDGKTLPDGGVLHDASVQDTVELDEVFRAFDPRTRRYFQEWLHDAGIAYTGEFASDLNDSLGNAAPFVKGGADLLRPLDEQEVALRRVVRDTGRTFHAISRENGQLRGLITNGEATFAALSARDDALAETFQILPTFLRETRTTV